jgi:predicted N-acyltransferase
VNFCLDDERAALEAAGFLPRLGFQYHWTNPGYRDFDDYLDSLRSKRRNQVRRERRELEAQGVRVDSYAGRDIPEALLARMFEIYLVTVQQHSWGRQYLNPRFFELLAERFRERLCFAVARRGEELVAGAVNVQKDALYGRYWGALEPLRHLHFNVCYYAGIEHCIRAGLARFEPGAGGEYKQLRGFDATPTWSCHFLADPRLHEAVGRYLAQERAEAGRTIEWFAEHTAHRRDDGARLEALRRRLSPPRAATPGART